MTYLNDGFHNHFVWIPSLKVCCIYPLSQPNYLNLILDFFSPDAGAKVWKICERISLVQSPTCQRVSMYSQEYQVDIATWRKDLSDNTRNQAHCILWLIKDRAVAHSCVPRRKFIASNGVSRIFNKFWFVTPSQLSEWLLYVVLQGDRLPASGFIMHWRTHRLNVMHQSSCFQVRKTVL